MRAFTIFFILLLAPIGVAQEQKKLDDTELRKKVEAWEKQIKTRVARDDKFKQLAKYSFVLLHSVAPEKTGQAGYSFVYQTKEEVSHRNKMDLWYFDMDGMPYFSCPEENQLLVRLANADFEKSPDPKKIAIDHPGIITRGKEVEAKEGELFLQRVRDRHGSDFFVVFQIVAVDPEARYMAFVWRMLPGGKRVVRKD